MKTVITIILVVIVSSVVTHSISAKKENVALSALCFSNASSLDTRLPAISTPVASSNY